MKLLYACAEDSADRNVWSGLVSYILAALRKAGFEVQTLDRIRLRCPIRLRLLHQFHKRLGGKVHMLQLEPKLLKHAARFIEREFQTSGCDAVFTPGTGVPVGVFVDPKIPKFTYLDATKRSWIESYHGLDSLCRRSRRIACDIDLHGVRSHALTLFSSNWAAGLALRETGAAPEKVGVVPFGANLENPPTSDEVATWVLTRSFSPRRLLFLGKEWKRKGGRSALEVVERLRARGTRCELDILGCRPDIPEVLPPWVKVHGFLDRSTTDGRERFEEILRQSHFLLFLSDADASPLALCEASAYGVPSIATTVGGIPEIVEDGVSGLLCRIPIDLERCANQLSQVLGEPNRYRDLAFGARRKFEAKFNWSVAGLALRTYIEKSTAHERNMPGFTARIQQESQRFG